MNSYFFMELFILTFSFNFAYSIFGRQKLDNKISSAFDLPVFLIDFASKLGCIPLLYYRKYDLLSKYIN